MLSFLFSLPVSVLCFSDNDKFYEKGNQLYESERLTRCYTQYALRPFIDSEVNHKGCFIKIPFVNKGIDFNDVPSIFKDRSVIFYISDYFENKEPPIKCYKCNKHISNTKFNSNKLDSDIDINTNTPDT